MKGTVKCQMHAMPSKDFSVYSLAVHFHFHCLSSSVNGCKRQPVCTVWCTLLVLPVASSSAINDPKCLRLSHSLSTLCVSFGIHKQWRKERNDHWLLTLPHDPKTHHFSAIFWLLFCFHLQLIITPKVMRSVLVAGKQSVLMQWKCRWHQRVLLQAWLTGQVCCTHLKSTRNGSNGDWQNQTKS